MTLLAEIISFSGRMWNGMKWKCFGINSPASLCYNLLAREMRGVDGETSAQKSASWHLNESTGYQFVNGQIKGRILSSRVTSRPDLRLRNVKKHFRESVNQAHTARNDTPTAVDLINGGYATECINYVAHWMLKLGVVPARHKFSKCHILRHT